MTGEKAMAKPKKEEVQNVWKEKEKKKKGNEKGEKLINRESSQEDSQIAKEFETIRIAQNYLTLNNNELSRKRWGSKCVMREVLPGSVTYD